jgi:hypothetical protein
VGLLASVMVFGKLSPPTVRGQFLGVDSFYGLNGNLSSEKAGRFGLRSTSLLAHTPPLFCTRVLRHERVRSIH